jgi:uncharacterized protein
MSDADDGQNEVFAFLADPATHGGAPPVPMFVAIGGLSGTGKSRLARELAPKLVPMPGAVIVRSDVERKALFGIAETEKLQSDAYTDAVTARVYASLADQARRTVAAGHAVVVDAVFARPQERAAIAAAAKAVGAGFQGLFLIANIDTRLTRIGGRRGDASDADTAVALAQEGYDLGDIGWTEIDASGTPETTLARAIAALQSP